MTLHTLWTTHHEFLAEMIFSGRRARTWGEVSQATLTAVAVTALACAIVLWLRKRPAFKPSVNALAVAILIGTATACLAGVITYFGGEESCNHALGEGGLIGAKVCGSINVLGLIACCIWSTPNQEPPKDGH